MTSNIGVQMKKELLLVRLNFEQFSYQLMKLVQWVRFNVAHDRSMKVEQFTASPTLNLQIVLFLQKEHKSFLFGFSFWSWQRDFDC